jgi:predicted LPLAT superfamily acyltransferase
MSAPAPVYRVPGPGWGVRFVLAAQHRWPRWLFRPLYALGTWIAVLSMGERRRHSRNFLSIATGQPAGWCDAWRHFATFMDVLLLKFRVMHGLPHECRMAGEGADAFVALLKSDEPALFGTFHFGHSDMLGFELTRSGRKVAIVRLRATDSGDVESIARDFPGVSFIWSNDPANLLFDLKAAIEAGRSLALQCDRLGYSARNEPFRFLGAERMFPFTIYHLAVMFGRPVVFCFGVPESEGVTRVHASSIFRAAGTASREANLAAAREHFQGVLGQLETLVRQYPTLWFNFTPLNPVRGETVPARAT